MATKLTQKLVDRTVSADGTVLIWDEEVRGLGFRVSPGAKSFCLNYRLHNIERRITLGRCDEMSLAAARKKAMKLRGQIAEGIDPLQEKAKQRERAEQEREAPTMTDLCREYQEAAKAWKREHTLRDDKRMCEVIIGPQLGSRKVSDVTSEDIGKLHRSLKATPYQGNRVLSLLSAMLAWAKREKKWRSGDNPCKGVPRYHEDTREYWLSEVQLDSVTKLLEKHPKRAPATALSLIILIGCRKTELLSATWTEFDLDRAFWQRPSHHSKAKRIETVPLSSRAVEVLSAWKLELEQEAASKGREDGRSEIRPISEYVFPGRAGHLQDVKMIWREIRDAAGVPQARVHDLRHTYASHLVSKGTSLHIVGKLLGHTQPQTTWRYAHVADGALRDATNAFAAIVKKPAKAAAGGE